MLKIGTQFDVWHLTTPKDVRSNAESPRAEVPWWFIRFLPCSQLTFYFDHFHSWIFILIIFTADVLFWPLYSWHSILITLQLKSRAESPRKRSSTCSTASSSSCALRLNYLLKCKVLIEVQLPGGCEGILSIGNDDSWNSFCATSSFRALTPQYGWNKQSFFLFEILEWPWRSFENMRNQGTMFPGKFPSWCCARYVCAWIEQWDMILSAPSKRAWFSDNIFQFVRGTCVRESNSETWY
jgi:hypothetical protein